MPRTRTPSLYETALAYLAAGRSVVPIAPGRKAPSVVGQRTGRRRLIPWECYQNAPATPDEVRRWFAGPQPMGLGLVAGSVSGITLADGTRAGLEVLDFDDPDIHARFLELIAACGASALLESLVCEATPGGGRHYGYCCAEWGASTTLAQRRVGTMRDGCAQTATLIETRGQGGQCVVPPPHRGFTRTIPRGGIRWCRGTGRRCRRSPQKRGACSGRAPARWMRFAHDAPIVSPHPGHEPPPIGLGASPPSLLTDLKQVCK